MEGWTRAQEAERTRPAVRPSQLELPISWWELVCSQQPGVHPNLGLPSPSKSLTLLSFIICGMGMMTLTWLGMAKRAVPGAWLMVNKWQLWLGSETALRPKVLRGNCARCWSWEHSHPWL